jgi:hypothetical protein
MNISLSNETIKCSHIHTKNSCCTSTNVADYSFLYHSFTSYLTFALTYLEMLHVTQISSVRFFESIISMCVCVCECLSGQVLKREKIFLPLPKFKWEGVGFGVMRNKKQTLSPHGFVLLLYFSYCIMWDILWWWENEMSQRRCWGFSGEAAEGLSQSKKIIVRIIYAFRMKSHSFGL